MPQKLVSILTLCVSFICSLSNQFHNKKKKILLFPILPYRLSSNENDRLRGMADKLTIQEILRAAGVTSLDEPSDALNAKGKPFRRHGIVLHMAIIYQNSESTFLGTG